ncbi:MAG: hypothetical protein RI922_1331 [Bacteroidota bacterium]
MITFKKLKNYYNWGGRFLNDPYHTEAKKLDDLEISKAPLRSDIINFLINSLNRPTCYLEIGVRNPAVNFDKIQSEIKYSVDPGIEFKENPVDFKVTSDVFFENLRKGEFLDSNTLFDVIFIDGLHLADQVDRDICNALEFIKEDGFIVLHDCNPPTEWHAREAHRYEISPAMQNWNGTTWKGFMKWRNNPEVYSCTIDTDWGVGVISKTKNIGIATKIQNPFYEYHVFSKHQKECLNLISFEEFKKLF